MANMKSPEELMVLAQDINYEMSAAEDRLLDRVVFEQTGNHIDKFKKENIKKQKKIDKDSSIISPNLSGKASATLDTSKTIQIGSITSGGGN
jgi:hypothetical protein